MTTIKTLGRRLTIITLVLGATTAWGDSSYLSDRAAALDLAQKGKPEEAAAEFSRLSETPLKDPQKDDALYNAALAWQKAGQPDKALEAAQKISSPPVSTACQIELLKENKKWTELLALSETVDFKTWPDRLISNAYYNRAKAHQAKGDLEAAEADFILAGQSTVSARQTARVAMDLGSLLSSQDSQKALDAYARAINGSSTGWHARRARALLLIELKEWPQALEEISLLQNEASKEPYWTCAGFLLTGQYHQAKGEPAEAIANFDKAIAVPQAPEDMRKQAETLKAGLKTETAN